MTRVAWIALVVAACGAGADVAPSASARPEPISDHECGSCGMIVREQPSPRAQLVHRDGTHAWFCSIADLVAYQGSPSPHGRVERAWVEALPADFDPQANEVAQEDWVEAERATFVLGVERDMVMGTPALSFASADEARAAAERLGARAESWDDARRELGGAP